ncbi:hypothetical protein EVAR_95437_1 [Eumeta japonica]|uniref:Uncharacterized protein n=1 Tax=Eumeta variegata TaxID=151549 RepID=A0A4C1VLA7_EUMVA|nr:hypothetical protein EVAR_95437_1 [Eumeta japonica]
MKAARGFTFKKVSTLDLPISPGRTVVFTKFNFSHVCIHPNIKSLAPCLAAHFKPPAENVAISSVTAGVSDASAAPSYKHFYLNTRIDYGAMRSYAAQVGGAGARRADPTAATRSLSRRRATLYFRLARVLRSVCRFN